jgi:hypothetical protein
MSIEWLAKNLGKSELSKDFSKGIWIPTEAGDMTINQLYAKIEGTLTQNSFVIRQGAVPEEPLDFELNIVTSHGDRDIALFQSLYLNETDIVHSTQNIVAQGLVMVLFICHSGSMIQDVYRYQFDSLIKYYSIWAIKQ